MAGAFGFASTVVRFKTYTGRGWDERLIEYNDSVDIQNSGTYPANKLFANGLIGFDDKIFVIIFL